MNQSDGPTRMIVPDDVHLKYGRILSHPPPQERIVISGIAGAFPATKNIEEFRHNLYNKIDMITPTHRPGFDHPDLPARNATFPPILDLFDAGFFGISMSQADNTQVGTRMALEKVIEAIFDAGMNPKDLENTRTGVFVGVAVAESITTFYSPIKENDGRSVFIGTLNSLLGSNISRFLRLKGPVLNGDTACSTSSHSLDSAFQALRQGLCDTAIVCSHNFCLHPGTTLQFAWLGVLSPEGLCQPFDINGNGYVRAEALGVIILQKVKDAKRAYAELIHSKTNSDGFKEEGITCPNPQAQQLLMEEVYMESSIDPKSLSYLEAHGTGTVVGDPAECTAIDDAFWNKRRKPILIGSVKSNMGHTEPVAGLCSALKVIFAMESGKIAPNFNFKVPRPHPALDEGRLRVVTEVTDLVVDQPIIGVNSFGFGGSNSHILLRPISRRKVKSVTDNLPRLLCASGRTVASVETLLDEVVKNQDSDYIRLLQNIFRRDVSGHIFKGYTVIHKGSELRRSIRKISLGKLPVHLVFGDFKNWYPTITELMELPILRGTIERLRFILNKNNIDLESTILSADSTVRRANNTLGSFITSVCIAIVLKKLDTKVVGATGYSTGKIVGNFYGNKLDLDETLAHARTMTGKFTSSSQINGICNGSVAEKDTLNTIESISPSGKYDSLKKSQSIGRRSIILHIGGKQEQEISAENSQIFTVENVADFLSSLGSLYQYGHHLPIEKLFPEVTFPVCRNTPTISSSIKWIHQRKWKIRDNVERITGRIDRNFEIGLKNKEWSFISDHVIDGRILFPAAGYLYLAWKTLQERYGPTLVKTLTYKNCRFIRATTMNDTSSVTLKVSILNSGHFEIMERDAIVMTGEIYLTNDDPKEDFVVYTQDQPYQNMKEVYKELRLRGYHYSGKFKSIEKVSDGNVKGLIKWNNSWISFIDAMFQIKQLYLDSRTLYVPTYIAEIKLHVNAHETFIKKSKKESVNPEDISLPVQYHPETDRIRCGGAEVVKLLATAIKRRRNAGKPVLEKYEFFPNYASLDLPASVRVNTQIILENTFSSKVKSVELIDNDTPRDSPVLTAILIHVLEDEPLTHTDSRIFCETPLDIDILVENKTLHQQNGNTLVIGSRFLSRPEKLVVALNAIKEDGYIISREPLDFSYGNIAGDNVILLTIHRTMEETLVLIGRPTKRTKYTFIDVSDPEDTLYWMDAAKKALSDEDETILYSHKNMNNGLLGLINCLRREPGGKNLKSMLLLDEDLDFDQNNPFFTNQLAKNMAINVLKNGEWGTYRHLLLEKHDKKWASDYCVVNQTVKGDLSSLKWFDKRISCVDNESLLERDSIEVHYASLNFKDIMLASGKINVEASIEDRLEQDNYIGFEFSGKNSKGEKVMGMVSSGALATIVNPDPSLVFKVPDNWSLSEAATIPVVYSTILYALSFQGKMRSGDSILIHSGTGGIGQAAIGYALFHGCTVYTTVGNDSKREFLKRMFPQLSDDNIGNSRDNSFERMIMKRTDGRGVDLVLNSLAEDKLITSVKCLARGGRFLEIGKFDMIANKPLNLLLLEKDASFHGVMLDKIFCSEPPRKRIVKELVDGAIAEGSVKPLNTNIFKCDELEQAFRFMAGGKHMGKVLIEVRGRGLHGKRDNRIIPRAKFNCTPNMTYVIVGGLGGFGLELADWLILRGARKIVFSSRNGIKTGYQRNRIRVWRNYGVSVAICTADVTKREGCVQLIRDVEKLGPICALFNLAAVLQDAVFDNQTVEMFRTSLAPKAVATRYLDEVTREMCTQLSHFVVFSSVSCGRGNTGQSNYGMGNSVMERICEQRRKDGFPALAIQWGAIGEVGLVADMQEKHQELEISGTLQQMLSSCMEVLDILLTQKESVIVSSMVVAEKKSVSNSNDIANSIALILGITDIKSVSTHSTLAELGLDSMTAIEIKQILERDFDLFLSSKEIRNLTLDSLMKIQEARVGTDAINDSGTSMETCQSSRTVADIEDLYRDKLKLKSRLSVEATGPTIFMFPGVEGTSKALSNLALNLKAHVVVLPYNFGTLLGTIPDMANSHIAHIEENLEKDDNFNIVAYSFGVCVALEVIRILESRGYRGKLIVLDGSPVHSKELLKSINDYHSEIEFGNKILYSILESDWHHSEDEMKYIQNSDSIDQAIDKGTEIISRKSDISKDILKNIFKGILLRSKAMREYKPVPMIIHSKVIVCKPTVGIVECPDDLGLSEICGAPVEIFTFEGDHYSLIENLLLAEKINSLI